MMKKTSMILALIVFLMSFSALSQNLNTGPWRFELDYVHGKVPFIITIQKDQNGYKGILHNGKEKIPLTDIRVTKKKVIIPLQTYEMTLETSAPKKGKMAGNLIRHNKNPKVRIPVTATHGINERFPVKKLEPRIELGGRWQTTITDEAEHEEPGILIIEQNQNLLTGSLLTPTGDYRYLEGYVSGNEFEMASFDGVYNYLLKGKVQDGKMEAAILSSYKMVILGKKNSSAELPDAYKQTQIEKLNFTFPDLDGNNISLNDPKFQGKPVIIQIFGSWCPNCIDETNYLSPWYLENQKRGVEIIALSFERSLTTAEAKRQLRKTQNKRNIPYTLLLAGSTSSDKPMEKLPGLTNFISFPTTIFLNKKHEVVKVHAGFNGPSTGEYFETWKKEFNETVNGLLK